MEGQSVHGEDMCKAYLKLIIEANNEIGIPLLRNTKIFLKDVYVALRGRMSDTFNPSITRDSLPEAIREVSNAKRFEGINERKLIELVNNPSILEKPIDVDEREQPKLFQKNTDEVVTLGEAFRRKRRLVILGDPGSGKTTLLRWLAVILSAAYSDNKTDRVEVSLSSIDPDAGDDNAKIDDLGFKRIPIFIKVSSFHNWRKTNPEKQLLSDYIGYHIAQNTHDRVVRLASGKNFNLKELHEWLEKLIEEGKTVLLIDGLDEIDNSAERGEIVSEISSYLNDVYLGDSSPKLSTSEILGQDYPVTSGGNQVVITSRIVGYELAHLGTRSTHLTIEPMSKIAIKRFCSKYVTAARRSSVTNEKWVKDVELKTKKEAEQFFENIMKLQGKGVTDLTSNPIQLSILATLYLSNNAQLPEQRTKLYQAAIEEFLKHYDKRTTKAGNHEKIIKVLSQLAAEILEKSSLGYITDTKLKKALKDGGVEAEQIDEMLKLAGEGAGLLTMRVPGIFSFLHLTFQEYLAGAWLLSQPKPEMEILKHIDSTRWREALLMALGQQALLSARELEQLVRSLLAAKQNTRTSCSTSLLLVASALREMENVPDAIIHDLVEGIVGAYSDSSRFKQFPQQLAQLESAFRQLCDSCISKPHSNEKLQEEILHTLELGQRSS